MNDKLEKADSIVQIDPLNLDKECIRLPGDYLKYAHLTADAKRDCDELKSELEVCQAELAKLIRQNPEFYGLEKITEAALAGTILLQPKFKKLQYDLIELRHQSELAQAVVWALEHKKRSLTLMVELHGLGYFSSPKISPAGKAAVEQMTQRKVRIHREDS